MSDTCDCIKDPPVKSKWNMKFLFGKKKKKKEREEIRSIPEGASGCPLCAQIRSSGMAEPCMVDVYEEKQRMRAEVARQNPTYPENNPPDLGRPDCDCTKCRRARGEDPLTVELLPMETQITLQNSLQDTILMCAIL